MKDQARALRDEGLTYGQIAKRLGVALSTVYRWVNPERTAPYRNGRAVNPERAREVDRAYKRRAEVRGRCGECGNPMGIGCLSDGICMTCRHERRDAVCQRIVKWWAEGKSMNEISEALGWTRSHLGKEIDLMRTQGYDLPYRYRHGKRNGHKFPHLRSAA